MSCQIHKGRLDPVTFMPIDKRGEFILFGYHSSNIFFHASIYIGNNKVIHAGFKKGQTTSVLDLDSASVKNTKIRFVRLDLNG